MLEELIIDLSNSTKKYREEHNIIIFLLFSFCSVRIIYSFNYYLRGGESGGQQKVIIYLSLRFDKVG